MKKIQLTYQNTIRCPIYVGHNLVDGIKRSSERYSQIFYITEKPLLKHLRQYLGAKPAEIFTIAGGESSKTLKTAQAAINFMLSADIDRSSLIVGFGGGVVTDLTGFVASILLRGVNFLLVPTTLLGMIDATIGGKTGVNFANYKNMVGTIAQPQAVFIDIEHLRTLPKEQFQSGLGELVKCGVGFNKKLFWLLEKGKLKEQLAKAIYLAAKSVAKISAQDPEDKLHIRDQLNLGHTLGHALESTSGFKLMHGLAVAKGLEFAAYVSCTQGHLSKQEYERIVRLLKMLDLVQPVKLDPTQLIAAIKKDKKRVGEEVYFVFIKAIGQAFVEPLSLETLGSLITSFTNSQLVASPSQ